ncbi:MAG: DUF2905 domain-containing protein [Sedimentisphaerales bacterium]|nr:DUF2905 domain-containing protein [Sedimentisphaerales bacterium]
METGPQQIGKIIIFVGLCIVAMGVLIIVLGKFGLFKLPGDLEFGSRNWKVYIPIASSIVLSIILTFVLWLINYFRR